MDLNDLLLIATSIIGAGGIGALVNALWTARKEARREPLDHRTIQISHQVDLVGAADQMVKAQASVISGLQKQVGEMGAKLDSLEARFQVVLDELEHERQRTRDQSHELERYRLQLAGRDERIADLEELIHEFGERIDVLEAALRAADIDPEEIGGEPI